jgi:hypothetical protein
VAINYEGELEMELEREFGGDYVEGELEAPSDDTANASAADGRRSSRELYAKYQSACKGRRILKRLTRAKLNPLDEAILLQARIDGLPQLFRDLAALDRRALTMSNRQYRQQYAQLVTRLGYPPNVYLGRLEDALAQARCDLSWSNWRFVALCDGMEVDDPEGTSIQVADHYTKTELGRVLASLKVTCGGGGRWCDVDYPGGITIRVGFYKIPDSIIAVQVAPKSGPLREYTYSCFGRTLSLR